MLISYLKKQMLTGKHVTGDTFAKLPECCFSSNYSTWCFLHQISPDKALNKLESHFNTRPLSHSVSAGNFKGLCKQIDHFPEDADYEADAGEYFLRK